MTSPSRVGTALRTLALSLGLGRSAAWRPNETYVDAAPSLQQTVDVFRGDWASILPLPGVTSGRSDLFDDHRIRWMLERLGGAQGFDVLELGPLEGGHSWMLERAGARITAIEGNKSAFLKCLLVQRLLDMERTEFLLGDFDAFLRGADRRWDLVVASGVLYHLADPLRTVLDMTRVADRLFIWSHFHDADAMPPGDRRRRPFTGETRIAEHEGERLTYHVRSYLGTHRLSSFCGGRESAAVWMESDELVALLERRGFRVERGPAMPDHPAGPALCLLAVRTNG